MASFGAKVIDFDKVSKIATLMSDSGLRYSILDCQKTLENADAMDRLDGGNRGGYYRDEISVYRDELNKREYRDNSDEE